jgi:hypothetical protein
MLHRRCKECQAIAFVMATVADCEGRLDHLCQHRAALAQFSLPQVLAVQVKQIEGIEHQATFMGELSRYFFCDRLKPPSINSPIFEIEGRRGRSRAPDLLVLALSGAGYFWCGKLPGCRRRGDPEYERGLVLNHSGKAGVTAGYSHGYSLDLKRQLLCNGPITSRSW